MKFVVDDPFYTLRIPGGNRAYVSRAAGFEEIGPSRGGRRVLVHYQGRVISEREARRLFGTSRAAKLAALGLKVETVPRRARWCAERRAALQNK
jgi:hypothetical protein